MLNYNELCDQKSYDVYPIEQFKKAGYIVHTQVPGIHWIENKKSNSVRVYIHIKISRDDPTLARMEVQNLTVSTDYEKVKSQFDMVTYNFVPCPKDTNPVKKCRPKIISEKVEIIKPILEICEPILEISEPILEICDIIVPQTVETVFDGTLNFD